MIQKKKFVKTFRNTKTVQLVLLLLLEATYVLVLTLNPALGTKLFEDRTLFILCTLSWILALFNLIWLLYDFYKLRTFAEESHALNRAAFLDHLTGIPNRHGLDVVFETYDSPESLAHVACYMVTITNLKEINQTMGHVVGDQMLKDFSGTLIFVSHDRYFVRKVANRLLVFEDGTTHLYQFGYEEYQEKLDREAAESGDDYRKNPAALGGAISQNGGTQQSKGTQETGGKKAYYNPGKERSKIEKKVKKAEEELAVKEEKLDALKQELLRPEYQSSYSKLTEIQGEIDALEEEIMADMENWEALSQQLEELEG